MAIYQRILEFKVSRQRLIKDENCDFTNIVRGSVGYLRAKFQLLSDEWGHCNMKIARFWLDDQEYSAILDDNNSCEIPPEVLTDSKFKVSVLGVGHKYRIETNKTTVKQEV